MSQSVTLPHAPFEPSILVRSTRAQTILARLPARNRAAVVADEQPILLDAGPDETGSAPDHAVRLLAYYNRRLTDGPSRGTVLTLHGWCGCSHSSYNIEITAALLAAGYDVVRLNLRDHGPDLHVNPYALNRGLFAATLLREVATAVSQAAQLAGNVPFYITGTSMGGNFALRLALWFSRHSCHNLARVVAVNPAINPARSIAALDARPTLRRYFRRNWVNGLRAKQQAFPALYDFRPVEHLPSIYDMTDWLVKQYTPYGDADVYFDRYATTGNAFESLAVPTTIITASDDGLIPVVDFYALAPATHLDVQIHASGGHVGYVDLWPFGRRLPELILHELQRGSEQEGWLKDSPL